MFGLLLRARADPTSTTCFITRLDELEFQIKSTPTPHTLKRGRQSRNTNKEKGASTQSIATWRRPKKLKTGQKENKNKSEGTLVVTHLEDEQPSENVHIGNS